MMRIHIKNLRLRTIIGVNDRERRSPRNVIVNVTMEFDGSGAVLSDDLKDCVDYKAIERRIAGEVGRSNCRLLEKLAHRILELVMEDPKVQRATVQVDKPSALSFADSVSVSCSTERER